MTNWGGTGGVTGGRGLDLANPFEVACEFQLGERVRASVAAGEDLWAALSNVVWRHESGDEAVFSFRRAGDLVAALRQEGDYMEWQCCIREGVVAEWISEALSRAGWTAAPVRRTA